MYSAHFYFIVDRFCPSMKLFQTHSALKLQHPESLVMKPSLLIYRIIAASNLAAALVLDSKSCYQGNIIYHSRYRY